jgi:anaerobic magnesium-protoporphyrin IX monomethyl ester cyclase
MSDKFPIRVEVTAPTTLDEPITSDSDPHVEMARVFAEQLKLNRKPKQSNLTPIPVHVATRKTRVAFASMPMWGPQVAPYGIARLAGLSRVSGYETRCWDLNIKCYQHDKNLWHWHNDWKWSNQEYFAKDIRPNIEPVIEKFLTELVEFKPDVIGFTAYYTNGEALKLVTRRIKELLPGTVIIIGGPEARSVQRGEKDFDDVDFVLAGEGEMIFSEFLDGMENGVLPKQRFITHNKEIRIDLDSVPWADYRDFNIEDYEFKGVASEVSRGCIAKCTFCTEPTFWRYRGRIADSVIDEVEYNYKTYGIESVWFIDSLVNGNLKELQTFAQGLIDRNIHVNWMGYARNDGRMDKAYLKVLLDSGLRMMQMGVESGSDKVVRLIDKKVTAREVEQNFRDLAELGSFTTTTSWFVGFPGEEPVDVAQTLTLMWRLRNLGVDNMGTTMCVVEADSPLGQKMEQFNIHPDYGAFGGWWITKDYKNTILHRLMRFKFVYVLQNHYRLHNVIHWHEGKRGEQQGFLPHYELTYDPANWRDEIPYELDFDFDIIKPNINPIADSVVNEVWALLRVLWLAMGPFELVLKFDPGLDRPIYGDFKYMSKECGDFWAEYRFQINEQGFWNAAFYNKLAGTYCRPLSSTVDFEFQWSGNGHWDRPVSN